MLPDLLTDRRQPPLRPRETPLSRRYLRLLEQWIPVGLEYYADWPDRPDCGHFLGGCHWYGIETIAGVTTFALAASSPEYDEKAGGCPRDELGRLALKGLRYLCFTHDTGPADCLRPKQGLGRPENCGTKWGERGLGFFKESQCGTTVAGMGIAALLLGDRVDEETWQMLVAVHLDYAARFGEMPPRSGVYFDTQMEENGWTSCGLAAVECLLARAPQAEAWGRAARRWMFSTATTPQDARNQGPFADQTVAALTGRTFTTLPDYMAENHGMVHPSYTASSLTFLERLGTIYGIHGRPLPEHARFNRQRIYDQLKRTTDRTGSFHPVQGMDWPYLPPDPGTGAHAAAAVLLGDPDAACLERRALTTLEARQQGNQGRLYDRSIAEQVHDIQDPLIVRESAIAGPAYTYLLHRLGGDGPRPTPEDDLERQLRGVRVYPHSGFVFHRHRAGQTSLAWRNIVMALPLDQGGIYTVAPAANSFLASVRVEDRADSQDLVSAEVETQDHSFAAALVLDRAQGSVRQEVLFAGLPDGRSLCWERLTARQRLTVESLQQGFLRIVNEHFARLQGNCDGFRILHTPAGKERFPGYVDPDPQSDQVRTYDHPAWVAVDDRLGLIFQGTGPTVYTNRHYFPTWWAVADDLVLSRLDRPFRAQPGAVIGQLATLIAPGRTARQTAGLQLLEPRAPRRAAGLLAGNYLAAANFDQKGRRIALSVPRANFDQKDRRIDLAAPHARLDPVPVFAGTAKITPRAVTYTLALGPGAATLRPALMTLSVEGEVEIVAAETGRVLARNTGDKTAAVTVGRGKETVRLQPETAVSLR